MSDRINQQIYAVYTILASLTPPQTVNDAFYLVAEALEHAFGETRCLFYLDEPVSDIDPLSLVPCPARQLSSHLFVYDAAAQSSHFSFETDQPSHAPLILAGRLYGYLFLEIKNDRPLDELEQTLLALLATHTVHQLNHLGGISIPPDVNNGHTTARIVIDESRRCVWVGNTPLRLSSQELSLLQLLNRHAGRPCKRDLICQVVYDGDQATGDFREDRLDTLIFRLRLKLRRVSNGQITIETIRGIGYQLNLQ